MATVEIIMEAKDNFSGVLGNFGSIITGIESAINLAGQAFDAATGFIQPFIDSAVESENAITDLNTTLKSTGGAVGLTSQQLQDMANNLQNVTKFSDETIISGEAMLLTFTNIGGNIFPQATEAMLNLAEKFGSVDSAAVQLGKALNDPISGITALSRVGVSFSEEQKQQIADFMAVNDIASAQGVILAELNKEFGGLAVAAGQTFAGQLEIAKNQLDNVKETIGTALLPVLSGLISKFNDALPVLQTFANAIAQAITTGNFTELFTTFEDGSNYLGDFIELLGIGEEKAYQFGDAINQAITNPFGGGLANLTQMLSDAITGIDWQQLSQDFAAGISSIDWTKVGQTLSQVTKIILDTLEIVIRNVDWNALLNAFVAALGDFIAGIAGFSGWVDMANQVSTVLAYEFNQAIGNWVAGIWSNVSIAWNYIKGNFSALGRDIVDGLRAGFSGEWSAWWAAVSDFFNRFITNVKLVLGISSPSTIFNQIGKDIVQGLIDGWNSLWNTLNNLIGNSIDALLELFAPFLALFGVDISNLTTSGGSTGGGTGTGPVPGGGTGGTGDTGGAGYVYNFYGTVYAYQNSDGSLSVFDCPVPNPFVSGTSGVVGGSGGGPIATPV